MHSERLKILQTLRPLKTAAQLTSLTIICAFLFWAQFLLVPASIAVLFAFVLQPLVRRIEGRWFPRPLAVAVVIVLALSTVAGLGWMFGSQLGRLLTELPKYSNSISEKVDSFRGMTKESKFSKLQDNLQKLEEEVARQVEVVEEETSLDENQEQPDTIQPSPPPPVEEEAVRVQVVPDKNFFRLSQENLGVTANAFFQIGLTLVLTSLFLFGREDLVERMVGLTGHSRIVMTTQALSDAGTRISRYLGLQFLVNLTYGIIASVGLWMLDVPYAVVWGVFAGLLRYIPFLGSLVGSTCAILAAFIFTPGWDTALYVFLFYAALDIAANISEPYIFGKGVGASSIAILILVVILGWLWGPVGAFLATPVAVCLVVLGEQVPGFSSLSWLISRKPRLEPQTNFYHRLIRQDLASATAVLENDEETPDNLENIETIIVPTLSQIYSDQKTGRLSTSEVNWITSAITDLVQDRMLEESSSIIPHKHSRRYAVCPPAHPLDNASLQLLEWQKSALPVELDFHIRTQLDSEFLEELKSDPPEGLLLLASPDDERRQVRRWRLRLESVGLDLPLVFFSWNWTEKRNTPEKPLRDAGATAIFRSFDQLCRYLENPKKSSSQTNTLGAIQSTEGLPPSSSRSRPDEGGE